MMLLVHSGSTSQTWRLVSLQGGKVSYKDAKSEVRTALLLKILVFRLLILHTGITCKRKIWNIELLYASVCITFACNRTCKHSLFARVVTPKFFTTGKNGPESVEDTIKWLASTFLRASQQDFFNDEDVDDGNTKLKEPFERYLPIYSQVFQVSSFLQVATSKKY